MRSQLRNRRRAMSEQTKAKVGAVFGCIVEQQTRELEDEGPLHGEEVLEEEGGLIGAEGVQEDTETARQKALGLVGLGDHLQRGYEMFSAESSKVMRSELSES